MLICNAHVQNLEFRGKVAECCVRTEDVEKQASAAMSSRKFLVSEIKLNKQQ